MNWSLLIGYKALSDLFGRLSVFAVILLAARLLPAEQFGVFSLAWAAGWIVAVASDFGLQISLTREVARRPSRAGETFRRLLKIRQLLCAALFGAALVVVLATPWPSWKGPFLLVILSQILNSLVDFHNHLFRGFSRSDLESSLNLASRALTLLLAVALLAGSPTLTALSLALTLGSTSALLAAHYLSRRLLVQRDPGRSRPGRAGDGAGTPLRRLHREALPIGLGILLSSLYFRADLFFIEAWRGSESVAHYNAVFKLIDALRLLPAAVMAVLFPSLCRPGATRLLLVSVFGVLAAGLLLTGAGAWQATSIIELCYGRSYLVATRAFQILLFSLPLLFVNFILTHRLIGMNRQRAFAILCACGLLLSLGLNLLLVPRYGNEGAALSCLLREAALTAACVVLLTATRPGETGSSRAVGSESRPS